MTIHKEGYRILFYLFATLVLTNIGAFVFMNDRNILTILILAGSILLLLFAVTFFRQPARSFEANDKFIFAPADGKIVAIEETEENEYFHDRRIQVSIFMSAFNVHVNHCSIGGTIQYTNYRPGKNLVAWHPKSSTANERSTIVIRNGGGFELMIRQIAGIMARRIVCYPVLHDTVAQGDELGFIKFGSRVDIFLPLNANIKVSLHQTVKGNKTVIAEI